MNRIKLSNGLIAFGGDRAVGKTRFLLKLANHLASAERVLFVSYADYTERLEYTLKSIDGFISRNLELNTTLGYYYVESFIELFEYIEYGKFTTVIIDNVEHYSLLPAGRFSYPGREGIVDALLFIRNKLNVRVIFSTRIISTDLSDDFSEPTLQNFIWPSDIINQCDQIYAIYRPNLYRHFKKPKTPFHNERIVVISLKNEDHKNESIEFRNEDYWLFS